MIKVNPVAPILNRLKNKPNLTDKKTTACKQVAPHMDIVCIAGRQPEPVTYDNKGRYIYD